MIRPRSFRALTACPRCSLLHLGGGVVFAVYGAQLAVNAGAVLEGFDHAMGEADDFAAEPEVVFAEALEFGEGHGDAGLRVGR